MRSTCTEPPWRAREDHSIRALPCTDMLQGSPCYIHVNWIEMLIQAIFLGHRSSHNSDCITFESTTCTTRVKVLPVIEQHETYADKPAEPLT